MIRTITTESGAIYETDGNRICRVNPNLAKRGAGEWQQLVQPLPDYNTEGMRLYIVMKSLAHHGADDHGTRPEDASPYTTLVTTPVVHDTLKEFAR